MLLKSIFTNSSGILVSRVLGFIRDLLTASVLGANIYSDIFFVAFKLPNLFRRIFAEGALSYVFVPMFNQKMLQSKDSAEQFSSKVFAGLLITLIALVILMQLAMPYVMILIAPGFHASSDKFDLTVLLCRITMPYIIFISLASLIGGMLNSINKFAAFAFVPVLFSIVIIGGTLTLDKAILPAEAIACSVIISGILQLLFMLACLRHNGFKIGLTAPHSTDPDITKLLILMGPAVIGSGAVQLNLFI